MPQVLSPPRLGAGTLALNQRTLLLKAGPSGRYLVDSLGQPFLLKGDAAWSLAATVNPTEADSYFANRAAKGFNTCIVELIESGTYGGRTSYNGDDPFGVTDFTTFTSAYWNHVDYLVATAARYGIVVQMVPLYLGNPSTEGWITQATAAGAPAIQTYGAFLGARYRSFDNIIWVNGGDLRPNPLTIPDALATGILGADPRHLMTSHWSRDSTGTDGSPSWLTLNNTYTDKADLSSRLATDYANHNSNLPTYLIESVYEGVFQSVTTATAQETLRQAWQAYLGGACGYNFGNHDVWQFTGGSWPTSMDGNGSAYMAKLHTLFDQIPWWKLVPDASSTLVTAGRGTIGTATYVSAALASDATIAVISIPTNTQITVDMSQMAGSSTVVAQWYDPTNGAWSNASGSPLAQTSQNFTAASNNAGQSDQVLVLRV